MPAKDPFSPEQRRQHGTLIARYELRLSQMTPYTKADAEARDKSLKAWIDAETEANTQKRVTGPEKKKLAELNKQMRRHRQVFDVAHRHWLEVKAVADELVAAGVPVTIPDDPTASFQPVRIRSSAAKKIEAARKHMYAEKMAKVDNKPPARDPEGMGYIKRQQQVKEDVEKQLRSKARTGDIALAGGAK